MRFATPRSNLFKTFFFVILVTILTWIFLPNDAWTADISKVQGSSVIVEDVSASVGDSFFAIDSENKKKGIIEITKVKGSRALGRITKGKAAVGWSLVPRGKSGGSESSGSSHGSAKSGTYYGVIAGYGLDSMSVPLTGSTTISMSGSGFSVKGAADIPLSSSFGARLTAGYDSFSATSGAYGVTISYFSADALARYFLMKGDFGVWLGGGAGVGVPMSKSSTILALDSIATTTLLYVGGGADVRMSPTMYIPFQIDYVMFLPFSDVKTSIIAFRAGLMLKF